MLKDWDTSSEHLEDLDNGVGASRSEERLSRVNCHALYSLIILLLVNVLQCHLRFHFVFFSWCSRCSFILASIESTQVPDLNAAVMTSSDKLQATSGYCNTAYCVSVRTIDLLYLLHSRIVEESNGTALMTSAYQWSRGVGFDCIDLLRR